MTGAPPEQPDPLADSDSSDPDSHAVLGKLEALLGRLRGADAPAAMPIAQAAIPTLTEAVSWASPDPGIAGAGRVAARGLIPTLTELVQLRDSPAISPAPSADGSSAEALRDRVRRQIDPRLESRLCEAALNRLDDTLAHIRHHQHAALDAWREDQAERLRSELRSEIERAIDAAVEEMLREQPPRP